jgi:hypothetical protein
VDRIAEYLGERPEKFLTDSGNNSGAVQQGMEDRGVALYTPVPQPVPGNPALRSDPTQPVPESQWPQLPRNNQKQLDKSCFIYDADNNQYYCPQGQALPFSETKSERQQGQVVHRTVYRCGACTGCPLAGACLSSKNRNGRTITRDEFEEVRERTVARMQTAAAQEIYLRRPPIAETPFAHLKRVFGIRQFLLCGLKKVRVEWDWAVTAFNLKKLAAELTRMRTNFAVAMETA